MSFLRFAHDDERAKLGVVPFSRCFSTLGCPELGLDEVLALAAKHTIDRVELRALGGTLDLPAHFAAHFGDPATLAGRLREARMRVPAMGTSLHLAGGTPAERESFLAFLPWAEAMGVRWLRVFDGRAPMAEDVARKEAAETVRWWRTLRRERAIKADIMVETHDLLLTSAAVQRFVADVPKTAMLWDTHHTWKRGGEDPADTWRALRESVVHVHVKDSISAPSEKHPYTMVLPGDGEFPMAALLGALRADNYAGAVSLEWERMWNPSLPPLDRALAAAEANGWW
jgi:sugar phosphate isomerase/epimerase